MVRAESAFACEWCGELHYARRDAFECEFLCMAPVNRADLVRKIEEWQDRSPKSAVTERHRKRLALYDRLAKEHGIGQEKDDGNGRSVVR